MSAPLQLMTTSLLSKGSMNPVQSSSRSSKFGLLPLRRKGFEYKNNKRNRLIRRSFVTCGMQNHHDFGEGRMVDEGMIVLRLRIKELAIMEKGQDAYVPSDWFEWEKKFYMHFQNSVYRAIGYLQVLLMDSRPSFALGIIAFVIASVLFSSGLFILHSISMIEGLSLDTIVT